ncbi:MAG: ABC transporter permease [Propionibacteriaceae bacterium]|nr:ABC transporter permease [Propionibacteriaceae bacterium]
MFKTLRIIIQDNWEWRSQILRLATTELRKEVHGTVLGWIWLLITPGIYLGVFWFGLAVGLRTGSPIDGVPYLVWLGAGIIPWFFISAMLSGGADVYRRYSYLVNRLRFPISAISSFYGLARLIVFLLTMILVFAIMALYRVPLTIYAVQFPVIVVVMYVFWTVWSMLTSPLSALSKDFGNLIRALSTPLFWLSGVLFQVNHLDSWWLRAFFAVNPITFFVKSIRASLCEDYWVWNEPNLIWPFVGVFFVMTLMALFIQNKLSLEVADVL